MKIDLESLSRDELEEVVRDAKKLLANYEKRRRAEARKAAEDVAREYGLSLPELLEQPRSRRAKAAVKFRNPEKPEETWTGRGRKPNWLVRELEAGRALDDFRI